MNEALALLKEFGVTDKAIEKHMAKTEAHLSQATQYELLTLNRLATKKNLTAQDKQQLAALRKKITGS